MLRNRRFQLRSGRTKKRYMNLGCGGSLHPDYINVDYNWTPGQELCWDVLRGLPLKSDSLDGIFTEHTLEHFSWQEAIDIVLPECFRVLKSGGSIRIVVPCAELAVDKYVEARRAGETAAPFRGALRRRERAETPMTPMMHLNNTFRRIFEGLNVGHKFVYDFQTLEYFLHITGFDQIRRAEYMSGRDPALLVDTPRRAPESLYIEASKP